MPNERPERTAPAEIYYNDTEAKKYTSNSHIIEIQQKLTERALELLALPEDQPSFILDIGCGSGLSGEGIYCVLCDCLLNQTLIFTESF